MGAFDFFKLEDPGVFPKVCRSCNRRYESFEDFIESTVDVSGKCGLAEYPDKARSCRVGIFRNCECGSTLLVVCLCRRDESAEGDMRRLNFDKMLDIYEKAGLDRDAARRELRKVMRGGKSTMLESVGLILA